MNKTDEIIANIKSCARLELFKIEMFNNGLSEKEINDILGIMVETNYPVMCIMDELSRIVAKKILKEGAKELFSDEEIMMIGNISPYEESLLAKRIYSKLYSLT